MGGPLAWPRRLAFARKRARDLGVRIDNFEWEQLEAHWIMHYIERDRCVYCRACAKTLDHVVPLRRGGPHSRDNLVPACINCNQKKGGLLIPQWLQTTSRIPDPIPATVLALTIRTISIKAELVAEGRIVEYGNPPHQEAGPPGEARLGQIRPQRADATAGGGEDPG